MNKQKILVDGLTALTDGHIVLYERLSKLGYEHLLLYKSSDRQPTIKNSVKTKKQSKIRFLELCQFIYALIQYRPAVVELYLHEFGRFGSLLELFKLYACKWLGVRVMAVCTGREILGFEAHNHLKKKVVRLALKMSKVFPIKEPYMHRYIEKFGIADPRKALFIHNGVYEDLKVFKFEKSKSQKTILFFNSFKKWRNIEFLVNAAADLINRNFDVVFLIVGARNDEELFEVKKLTGNIEESERWRVQIHKMNDNKEFYFGLSDLFVLPADFVWLNNSVLESMIFGVPVLLPDVEWVDRIVDHGVNGLIHVPMSKDSFEAMLIEFLGFSDEKRAQIAAAAKQKAVRFFGSKKRASLHAGLYEYIISDTPLNYSDYDPVDFKLKPF